MNILRCMVWVMLVVTLSTQCSEDPYSAAAEQQDRLAQVRYEYDQELGKLEARHRNALAWKQRISQCKECCWGTAYTLYVLTLADTTVAAISFIATRTCP